MKFKYILPNIVMKTPCQCTEWQLRKIRWGPVMHNLIKYRLERKQESFACPVGVTGIKVWLKNRAAVNYQLHMSLDRPASIQRWGQSCSLKYTSIVSQPVQAEAGKIRTCSFILGGGQRYLQKHLIKYKCYVYYLIESIYLCKIWEKVTQEFRCLP